MRLSEAAKVAVGAAGQNLTPAQREASIDHCQRQWKHSLTMAEEARARMDAIRAERHGHIAEMAMWVEALADMQATNPDVVKAVLGDRTVADLRAVVDRARQDGFLSARVRDGVDSKGYLSMIGSISMVNTALDSVRLGRVPVTLPGDVDADPHAYIHCTTLDQVIAESTRLIDRVERWAAQQNPR
jgi:hypothetical protein